MNSSNKEFKKHLKIKNKQGSNQALDIPDTQNSLFHVLEQAKYSKENSNSPGKGLDPTHH